MSGCLSVNSAVELRSKPAWLPWPQQGLLPQTGMPEKAQIYVRSNDAAATTFKNRLCTCNACHTHGTGVQLLVISSLMRQETVVAATSSLADGMREEAHRQHWSVQSSVRYNVKGVSMTAESCSILQWQESGFKNVGTS